MIAVLVISALLILIGVLTVCGGERGATHDPDDVIVIDGEAYEGDRP